MTAELFKILAICLTATAFCTILRQKSGEYALLVAVAAGVCISVILLKNIVTPINVIKDKLNEYGVESEYFKVALKAVGIGYVTSFIADSCRDSGQTSLAAKAEFAGKCAVFLISLPLIISVLDTAVGFIK